MPHDVNKDYDLNSRALFNIEEAIDLADELKIEVHELVNGARVLDFGVKVPGGLDAGIMLGGICMSNLGELFLSHREIGDITCPHVNVSSDHPIAACLLSQYAGWSINVDGYFAMGSGPMRAVAANESLFEKLKYSEKAETVIGVLESHQLPTEMVARYIAEKANVEPSDVVMVVAPASSLAGSIQVVARSIETALHQLLELDFDLGRIESAMGTAPLPPIAADPLTGIGWTNDAILYGGRVQIWVTGDDASLEEIGPKVPANSSDKFGEPFLKLFEEADRDFYKLDPALFSPAEVTFQNLSTGRTFTFGELRPDVLKSSYGW
ncbi:Methenyltetrahydromethanopterin cyclohydrolase [Polystyrenella longa]|uniref:Methenyltetrahydromethanopterin cyclohydrolase n=1 Tax=Polystyrenella longa TaxID=2528007 RepID=A0A518CLR7_9PLAN|nr:methenyltetrahydromethanopterin cyclohydrolase [Polystyrenella longa]QDU80176.1 Methenyltetrahydromethanopterin cyclohydrolase [Polystyrenella longa]